MKTRLALVAALFALAAYAQNPGIAGKAIRLGRIDGGTLPALNELTVGSLAYDSLKDRVAVSDGGIWSYLAPARLAVRAGVVFNGATAQCPAGVCVVSGSFNVTSVTWTATGRYTVQLLEATSSATAYIIQASSGTGDRFLRWVITDADTLALECDDITGIQADCSPSVLVFDLQAP